MTKYMGVNDAHREEMEGVWEWPVQKGTAAEASDRMVNRFGIL